MLKERNGLGIRCEKCFCNHLCLPRALSSSDQGRLNNIISNVMSLSKGNHVYCQDDKMLNIYAVYSGYCKEYWLNEEGNEHIDNFYFPGDLLGLESIPRKKHSFFAVALTDVKLCVIPVASLLTLMHDIPELLTRFVNITSYKMLNNIHVRMTTDAQGRVANFLLNIYLRHKERRLNHEVMPLPMSQIDISNFLGMAYETVCRTLRTLKEERVIKVENKEISIVDFEKLKLLCDPIDSYGQV